MSKLHSPHELIKQIKLLGNKDVAKHSQKFFKTGIGEYGEGDKFLGIRVPIIRKQVKTYRGLSLKDSLVLIKSEFHEIRLFAVLMLVDLFERGDESNRKQVFNSYLANTKWINNWDLVDSSAHKIVGSYLSNKSREPLYQLARSKLLWDKRIAMIACYRLIKQDDFEDTLELSKLFLNEAHDLMHKAVGWMLREVGNRNFTVEDEFLSKYYSNMPRTMLRYAIEKFPVERKMEYMNGVVLPTTN